MTVSIIIAVKTWQKHLEECVDSCCQLDFTDFEILVMPDESFLPPEQYRDKLKIIPTGKVDPAQKRDIALKYAKGDILAFLDDDAYPQKNWLKKAVDLFSDPFVAAVGGPAVTPPGDDLGQQASGAVYSSLLVSGNFVYRYIPKPRREIEDYPSCNFLVRKAVMLELGGFNTKYWPGEDTKLCLDITHKLQKKIIYDPQVLVYHHRRRLFPDHFRQIRNYAIHRGYFVKKFPETSLKISYFLPSILVAGILCGALLSGINPVLRLLYFVSISLYLFLVFIFSVSNGLRLIILVFSGIILTHITYGIYFIKGLVLRRLKEE